VREGQISKIFYKILIIFRLSILYLYRVYEFVMSKVYKFVKGVQICEARFEVVKTHKVVSDG
jgi:hypothetical protein